MGIDVVLTEAFDHDVSCLLQSQHPIEILFDDDVAEVHRNGPHKIELLLIPQFTRNVPNAHFQGMIPANFIAGTTVTPVDGIEIVWNRMPIFAKGTNDDMRVHGLLFAQESVAVSFKEMPHFFIMTREIHNIIVSE